MKKFTIKDLSDFYEEMSSKKIYTGVTRWLVVSKMEFRLYVLPNTYPRSYKKRIRIAEKSESGFLGKTWCRFSLRNDCY